MSKLDELRLELSWSDDDSRLGKFNARWPQLTPQTVHPLLRNEPRRGGMEHPEPFHAVTEHSKAVFFGDPAGA
jgi:hypothetical protein